MEALFEHTEQKEFVDNPVKMVVYHPLNKRLPVSLAINQRIVLLKPGFDMEGLIDSVRKYLCLQRVHLKEHRPAE